MNTKKPPLPIFIFLFCLGILCSFPMQGQQRDTQKEYNVDSTLYAYYMRCKAEVSSPIVMQMSDTLFLMAEEQGDQRMQAVALCNKLDYYYYKNNQPDSINHYVEIVKDFAKKTNQPKYYYFAWSKRLINYYIKQHQNNIALYEANKMMQEAEQEQYMDGIANAYNVLSSIYQLKRLYSLAIDNKKKEIEITLEYGLDKYNLSTTYSMLGGLYSLTGKTDEALECLNKSATCIYSSTQEFYYYVRLAQYYLLINDNAQAWDYLKKAKDLSNAKKEVQKNLQEYAGVLKQYYIATKQYEKALEAYDTFFHTDYAKINSSLYKETMMNKANLLVKMGRKEEAYVQYGAVFSYIKSSFEKNYPKEIDQLTTHFQADQLTYQNEQDRLFSYRFYLGGIIICTLALFLFLYFSWKKIFRLKESKRSQECMIQKAERAIKKKNMFLSNMSHEVRTPLNAIVGFSAVLSSDDDSFDEDSRKEFCEIIKVNSFQLLKLINDILDFSDFENDTYIVYLIDQRDVFFCDLREWKQVVLVCPKHKLATPQD